MFEVETYILQTCEIKCLNVGKIREQKRMSFIFSLLQIHLHIFNGIKDSPPVGLKSDWGKKKKKLLVSSSKGALVSFKLCNSPHPLMIPFHVERHITTSTESSQITVASCSTSPLSVRLPAQHSKHSCSICNQNVVDYITSVWILMLTLLDLASHKMNSCIGRSLQSVKKLTDSSWFLRRAATSVWSITMVLKYHIIGCIALWGIYAFPFPVDCFYLHLWSCSK